MISLKDKAKNPGYALGAMLYGLQNPISTEDVTYEVDMRCFSNISYDDTVCYGCAATCALQVVTGRSPAEYFTAETAVGGSVARAKAFDTSVWETSKFENAIDLARGGYFRALMEFFNCDYEPTGEYRGDVYCNKKKFGMTNGNWKKKIPKFERLIKKMHRDHPYWERFTAA